MKIRLICKTLALVGCLMASGCYITNMTLENRTGSTITVFSSHTKVTVTIPARRTEHLPHSSGPITVSVTNGPTWDYTSLSWFDDRLDRAHYMKSHPILYKGTRAFLIDTNGAIFALQSAFIGWDHSAFRETQPDCYPLRPIDKKDQPNQASQSAIGAAAPQPERWRWNWDDEIHGGMSMRIGYGSGGIMCHAPSTIRNNGHIYK
jgi:hypothetical protein